MGENTDTMPKSNANTQERIADLEAEVSRLSNLCQEQAVLLKAIAGHLGVDTQPDNVMAHKSDIPVNMAAFDDATIALKSAVILQRIARGWLARRLAKDAAAQARMPTLYQNFRMLLIRTQLIPQLKTLATGWKPVREFFATENAAAGAAKKAAQQPAPAAAEAASNSMLLHELEHDFGQLPPQAKALLELANSALQDEGVDTYAELADGWKYRGTAKALKTNHLPIELLLNYTFYGMRKTCQSGRKKICGKFQLHNCRCPDYANVCVLCKCGLAGVPTGNADGHGMYHWDHDGEHYVCKHLLELIPFCRELAQNDALYNAVASVYSKGAVDMLISPDDF